MLKDLIKVANRLDSLNLRKEADELDRIIKKLAWPWDAEPNKITKKFDFGDEINGVRYFSDPKDPYKFWSSYSEDGGKTFKRTIYCAPGKCENALYTEYSLEAWNKKIEYLQKGQTPPTWG